MKNEIVEEIRPITKSGEPAWTKREGFAWYALFACMSIIAFWRVLRLPYSFDDIAVLQFVGFYRAHLYSLYDELMITHNEHFIPLVRLLFMAASSVWKFNATGLRVEACLLHALGAWTVARMTMVTTQSRGAALFGGSLYAMASACAGSPVWVLTALNFLMPAVFLQMGLLAMFRRAGSVAGCALAYGAMLLAASAMGFSVIAALMYVPAVWLWGPRRPALRYGFAALIVCTAVAMVLFGKWDYVHYAHRPFPSTEISLRGLGAFAWLAVTPAGRVPWAMLPGIPLGFGVIAVFTLLAGGVMAFTWRWLASPTKKLLMVSWSAHLMMIFVVGIGRGKEDAQEWLQADRYAYFALVPVCFHFAAIFAACLKRWPLRARPLGAAAAIVVCMGLTVNNIRMRETAEWIFFKYTIAATVQARQYAWAIRAEGEKQPLVLKDRRVMFPGVPGGGMPLVEMFYTEFPRGNSRVKFVPAISGDDKLREDALVEQWNARFVKPLEEGGPR